MNNTRILLLVQSHAHTAALMSCIPHIRAHYEWVWVVYSPAVLADPALVEQEFDGQITDLTRAMRDCYAREDGAGGDAYKGKRDAAILEKSAKVKDAWKSLPGEQQKAAVDRLFLPFYNELKTTPGISVAITQGPDHFETAAHVEFQNSLKAGMKTGFVPGDYVVGWPTSLPKGSGGTDWKKLAHEVSPPADNLPPQGASAALVKSSASAAPVAKVDKRKGPRKIAPRLRELMQMDLDALGPIAFELGVKHNDPIMGKRMALVHEVHRREVARTADVDAY